MQILVDSHESPNDAANLMEDAYDICVVTVIEQMLGCQDLFSSLPFMDQLPEWISLVPQRQETPFASFDPKRHWQVFEILSSERGL